MVVLVNFPPPGEGVHHAEPNTKAYFGNEELGKGTLYISESVLCWLSNDGNGFSLLYPSIFIHAVSTDVSNFPEACLYLMIDGKITIGEEPEPEDGIQLENAMNAMNVGEGEEGTEDEWEEKTNEMRFVPDNKNMLDVMFRALLDCQALNPDPDEVDDDEDDDVVIAPPFNILVSNGAFEEEDSEEDEEDESDMNEDQFEDAES